MPEAINKYDGPERRKTDPERAYFDHLTLDQKVLWIADHRFGMKKPDDFDLQGFPGGDDTKSAVSRFFNRLEGKLSPEQQGLLDFLLLQCDEVAETWTEKYKIEGAPSKEKLAQAARKWLQGLSPENLQAFIDLGSDSPELVINPPIAVEELMKLINANKTIAGQKDGVIWSDLWNGVKSEGWTFAITNGAEDLPFDESIFYLNPEEPNKDKRQERTNEQMVAEYERRFEEKGLDLMPQRGYAPSAATRMANGRVLDRKFYTAFKKPSGAVKLPAADFNDVRVDLGSDLPDSSNIDLRCRPWLEGKMEI